MTDINNIYTVHPGKPDIHQQPSKGEGSPLDDATREEILAMVFNPEMERASIGFIWERLRRKYGALLPAECLTYYSGNRDDRSSRSG